MEKPFSTTDNGFNQKPLGRGKLSSWGLDSLPSPPIYWFPPVIGGIIIKKIKELLYE